MQLSRSTCRGQSRALNAKQAVIDGLCSLCVSFDFMPQQTTDRFPPLMSQFGNCNLYNPTRTHTSIYITPVHCPHSKFKPCYCLKIQLNMQKRFLFCQVWRKHIYSQCASIKLFSMISSLVL